MNKSVNFKPETSFTASLKVQLLEPRGPWQAALIPVPDYPMPATAVLPVRLFFDALIEVLRTSYGLHHHVALQVWKLRPETGAALVSENRRTWRPELGLGVWPTRTSPTSWTEETMMDAAAAAIRGDEPELPSHRLLRLTAAEANRVEGARIMRGFGVLLELFTREPETEFLKAAQDVLLPHVADRSFQSESFYLPLLDCANLSKATSPAQIDHWLCGADFYVRDSGEDKGILVLSRLPIQPILEEVKAVLAK